MHNCSKLQNLAKPYHRAHLGEDCILKYQSDINYSTSTQYSNTWGTVRVRSITENLQYLLSFVVDKPFGQITDRVAYHVTSYLGEHLSSYTSPGYNHACL